MSEKELQSRIARPDTMAPPGMEQPLPELTKYNANSPEAVQWAQNGAAWSDTSGFASVPFRRCVKRPGSCCQVVQRS